MQVVLHRRIIWLVGKAREYLSQELKDEFCTLMVAQASGAGWVQCQCN